MQQDLQRLLVVNLMVFAPLFNTPKSMSQPILHLTWLWYHSWLNLCSFILDRTLICCASKKYIYIFHKITLFFPQVSLVTSLSKCTLWYCATAPPHQLKSLRNFIHFHQSPTHCTISNLGSLEIRASTYISAKLKKITYMYDSLQFPVEMNTRGSKTLTTFIPFHTKCDLQEQFWLFSHSYLQNGMLWLQNNFNILHDLKTDTLNVFVTYTASYVWVY